MRIECPSCGVSGTADDSYNGKKIRCPKCDEVFRCRKEDEPVEIAEEVELPVDDEVEEEPAEVEKSRIDDEADLTPVGETTEEAIDELFDLPDVESEQVSDEQLIVELCDYCSGEGKPGERLEIVEMKKACSDCLPLLTGGGGKTANGFQPISGEIPVKQSMLSSDEKQGRKSLARNVVDRFKKLFSR